MNIFYAACFGRHFIFWLATVVTLPGGSGCRMPVSRSLQLSGSYSCFFFRELATFVKIL
jgi:hypothetical protein